MAIGSEIAKPQTQAVRTGEIARMDYEARISQAGDRLRFQQETGLAAIKSVMLANGGAILALLTFLGNKQGQYDAANLKSAFTYFCAGLMLALASYLGAYFSQGFWMGFEISTAWNHQEELKGEPHKYETKKDAILGQIALLFAIFTVMGSLAAFGFGAFAALEGVL